MRLVVLAACALVGCSSSGSGSDGGTCNAEVSTDSKNCGSCGHDCLGGECKAGSCQPVVLARNQAPYGLAVDGTDVYWSSGGDTVLKCASAGCSESPTAIATGQSNIATIALDDASVYWTTGTASGQLMQVSKSGGTPTALVSGLNYGSNVGITVYGGDVYFATLGDLNGFNGQLMSCPTTGGSPKIIASDLTNPGSIRVDGANVYFTSTAHFLPPSDEVETCPVSGCALPKQLYGGGDYETFASVALQDGDLYFMTGINGSLDIIECPAGDCTTPIELAHEIAFGIVADAKRIYWATVDAQTMTGGGIRACDKPACTTPVTLATFDGPANLVSDGKALYWSGQGEIVKLAK